MKVVILAGGLGTRLSEETDVKPKPMVEIGGKPILWHIMKIYSHFGFDEFIICCGYKGYIIKEYFANYLLHCSDVTVNLKDSSITTHSSSAESWSITLIDSGIQSGTAGRLLSVKSFLQADETFCFTYGDGLSNVDITQTLDHHHSAGKEVTLVAVRPLGRFGVLSLSPNGNVDQFKEKAEGEGGWVNGGFFVCNTRVLDRIHNASASWEGDVLPSVVQDEQLTAFRHDGFWQPMDTLREKLSLNKLWEEGLAPWKVWT